MSNKVERRSKKEVRYGDVYVKFFEEDLKTGEGTTDAFKLLNSFSAKIDRTGKYTFVTLNDGSRGVAKCRPGDEFSFNTGVRIAFNRALIQRLEKETAKLG